MGVRPGRGFAGPGASRGQAPKRRFTFLIFLTRIVRGVGARAVFRAPITPALRAEPPAASSNHIIHLQVFLLSSAKKGTLGSRRILLHLPHTKKQRTPWTRRGSENK